MSSIFSFDGPFMRFMSDLTTLILLNMVTLLLCIPIVTAGAAITSMHYGIMKMREGEAHIIQQYWREFKGNLRQVTAVWLINAVIFATLIFEAMILYQNELVMENLFTVVFLMVLIIVMSVFVWLYPLSSRFIYGTGAALKNAFLLAFSKLPRTLVMIVITTVIPVVLVLHVRLYPVLFLLGFSLPAYLCSFLYYPVIKDMIEKKLEEDGPADPEFDERLMNITPIFSDKTEEDEEE